MYFSTSSVLQAKLDDVQAFHCKIVCLIQLTKFQDALKHMAQNPAMAECVLL